MADLKELLADATWHNEPPEWTLTDDALMLTTGMKTDFWQDTFYGFRRDDGHFLGRDAPEDFTASVAFDAAYEVLYDQAGLMTRIDSRNWLKTGIEYSDDVTNFSVVVTRDGRSVSGPQTVRLTRKGSAAIVHFLATGGEWQLMRLADFPVSALAKVGPMACSPERAGLKVRFSDLKIGRPIDGPLHAD